MTPNPMPSSLTAQTSKVRQRLGIAVIKFPTPSETFIVTKVIGLLDAGFDLTIFAALPSQHWQRFDILKNRNDIRERVIVALPTRPFRKVFTGGVAKLLQAAARHPVDFMRFVRHNWRVRKQSPLGFWSGIYQRLQFVGQHLDILHVEFDTQALGLVDLKDYLGCKLLLSSRGTFQKTSVLDEFPNAPRYLYSYVDGYHFISRYLRDNNYKLGLSRSIPTWLIEPAIDLKLFATPPERASVKAEGVLHLITVARLAWQKGYEFAVDAVAHVYKAGIQVEYTIVGDGDYREAIEFAARQWGLFDKGIVRFVGSVPREDVIQYLQQADIMIHAAVEEGFCNAVIEGQAAGLPVVASDAGGLPENVEDGVTGFIVPRRNPEAMAEKIILLAGDPELRQRMGEAGRTRALGRFDLDKQIEAFIALYEELADGASQD